MAGHLSVRIKEGAANANHSHGFGLLNPATFFPYPKNTVLRMVISVPEFGEQPSLPQILQMNKKPTRKRPESGLSRIHITGPSRFGTI